MSATLRTFLESGALQLDTNRVTFGLLKSAPLEYAYRDLKKIRKYINSDTWYDSGMWDDVYKISFSADTPVVFLHGPGARIFIERDGRNWTYYYAGASTETRAYIFDLMQETGSGPRLATWDPSGRMTYNSRQHPMNVVANVIPPVPMPDLGTRPLPPGQPYYYPAYTGGTYEQNGTIPGAIVVSRWHYQMPPGRLYAASLQWSRGAIAFGGEFTSYYAWSVIEGAYGGAGTVSFFFTSLPGAKAWLESVTPRFGNVPTRLPAAQVIDVTDLPFPYQA